jgi:fibronectin-binding autotransporter adhesin
LSHTIAINRNTILNARGHNITISGQNSVRLFIVEPGVTFTLNGLVLADGRAQGTNGNPGVDGESVCGGAILNKGGSVTISNCILANNQAIAGGGGHSSATRDGDGGSAAGGAVCNIGGSVLISTSLLVSNASTAGPGGAHNPAALTSYGGGGDALGAALYSRDGTATLNASRLVANTSLAGAPGSAGSVSGRSGSGFGGGLFIANGTLAITNSDLLLNLAIGRSTPRIGGPAGVGMGGATFLSNCVAIIKRTLLATNSAMGGGRGQGLGGEARGGAVFNGGDLRIDECEFYGNSVSAGGGVYVVGASAGGGAVYNGNGLRIHASTFARNQATGGAGISGLGGNGSGGAIHNAGTLLSTNLTLVFNAVHGGEGIPNPPGPGSIANGGDGLGGGIFHESGSASVNHLTISSNSAIGGSSIAGDLGLPLGGGISASNSNLRLQNTIIAYSTNGSNCFGPLIDDGNNISTDASCPFTAPGSLSNTDPVLSPLGDFGGPTPTMALLAGSPAIDHALSSFCPTTDQRGHSRPHGAGCDVGAFESSPPFIIAGRITGYVPIGGIPVYGGSTSALSSASGTYTLWGLPAGSHTVTPSSPTMIALPDSQTIAVGPDILNLDFKSYRYNGFTVESYSNNVAHLIFAGTNTLSYEVQTGTNLVDWTPISTNVVGADSVFHLFYTNGPKRFFRTLGR